MKKDIGVAKKSIWGTIVAYISMNFTTQKL